MSGRLKRAVQDRLTGRDKRIGYAVVERLARTLHHEAVLPDRARAWLGDEAFRDTYRRFEPANLRRMDRVWCVAQFARYVVELGLEGSTAECGAYQGLTSYVICQATAGHGKRHHVFDSFEGLSDPDPRDGSSWRRGDLTVAEQVCRRHLAPFGFIEFHAGWIPQRFPDVADERFCLVHIDVDLYQPTRDSLRFFYERLLPGGVLICDDYGFTTCPGVREAMDEFFADRPEMIVHLPTGQGLVFKTGRLT